MLEIKLGTKRVEIPGDCTEGYQIFLVEGMIRHIDHRGVKIGSAGRRFEVHCPIGIPDVYVEIQKALSQAVTEEYDANPLYTDPVDVKFHMDTMQIIDPKKPTQVEQA